jgi:hypothetical protein
MNAKKIIIYSSLLFLHWIPRVLCILFAAFIGLFAMDVFGHGSGIWKTLVALFVHLIPTFLLLIILILSWKRPWIGGICYIALGIFYIVWSSKSGRGSHIIDFTLFLMGILFLRNWFLRKNIKIAQDEYREGN